MEKKYYDFFYKKDSPVKRGRGIKTVLLDRNRAWNLQEGVQYIIENPQQRELDKCIIVTGGKFLRVDEIAPTISVKHGPYYSPEKGLVYVTISSDVYYKDELFLADRNPTEFEFGVCGGDEEQLVRLPDAAQQAVAQFRAYMVWIGVNQLVALNAAQDVPSGRAFRIVSTEESLKAEVGRADGNLKTVSVVKLQTTVYMPLFQEGHESAEPEENREIVTRLANMTLEESVLPFSFQPVWMSPAIQAGHLTVNGQKVDGLVRMPGNGRGSYLTAAVKLGWLELPPVIIPDTVVSWMETGGRVCWGIASKGDSDRYDFRTIWQECQIPEHVRTTEAPSENQSEWVLVVGTGMYVHDLAWQPSDYTRLTDEAHQRTLAVQAYKTRKGHIGYTEEMLLGYKFLAPDQASPDDFVIGEGWNIADTNNSSSQGYYQAHRGGYSGGGNSVYRIVLRHYDYPELEYQADFGEVGEGVHVVIPQDGSGVYLRVSPDSPLRSKIELAQAITRTQNAALEHVRNQTWKDRYSAKFAELVVQLVSSVCSLAEFPAKADALLASFSNDYQKHQAGYQALQNHFSDTLTAIGSTQYIGEQVGEIRRQLEVIGELVRQGEYTSATATSETVRNLIDSLAKAYKVKADEVAQEAANSGVPDRLLEQFRGDIAKAKQFVLNVQMLPTNQLDSHEITCGRSRVTNHVDAIWERVPGAIGDFWCGTDANDVKWFVYQYHFGDGSKNVPVAYTVNPEQDSKLVFTTGGSDGDTLGDLFAGIRIGNPD